MRDNVSIRKVSDVPEHYQLVINGIVKLTGLTKVQAEHHLLQATKQRNKHERKKLVKFKG